MPQPSPELQSLFARYKELAQAYRQAKGDPALQREIQRQIAAVNAAIGKHTTVTRPLSTRSLSHTKTGFNRQDLIGAADAGSTRRSARVTSKLIAIRSGHTLVYHSRTYTQTWTQMVRLNLRRRINLFSLRKAIDSDLYVYCNCPAFKWWGYQYICTSRRIVLPGKENPIFPKIRNPFLVGSVCKHLIHVLEQLPQDAREIFRRLNPEQQPQSS